MSRRRHIVGIDIGKILGKPQSWTTLALIRRLLKQRGISTDQVLPVLESTQACEAIAHGLADLTSLLLKHREALRNGARFHITVQNSDES